jgi:hypothetical protein
MNAVFESIPILEIDDELLSLEYLDDEEELNKSILIESFDAFDFRKLVFNGRIIGIQMRSKREHRILKRHFIDLALTREFTRILRQNVFLAIELIKKLRKLYSDSFDIFILSKDRKDYEKTLKLAKFLGYRVELLDCDECVGLVGKRF